MFLNRIHAKVLHAPLQAHILSQSCARAKKEMYICVCIFADVKLNIHNFEEFPTADRCTSSDFI